MKLLIFSFKRYKTIIYTLIFNKSNKTNRNNIYSFRECPNNMEENRKYIVIGEYKNILIKNLE